MIAFHSFFLSCFINCFGDSVCKMFNVSFNGISIRKTCVNILDDVNLKPIANLGWYMGFENLVHD